MSLEDDGLFSMDQPTPEPVHTTATNDRNLQEVIHWFKRQKNIAERFGGIFRQAFDEVLDGPRTGRFNVEDLEKTEKTYLGTKVEILVRAEFSLDRGRPMDYSVAGHQVDSKFTVRSNWTIPQEAIGHICLLMSADDASSQFKVGLLRISDTNLNPGRNRDGKRGISRSGRDETHWLVPSGTLPKNILMQLSQSERTAIFRHSGGQGRTNELFRVAQRELIDRKTLLTVAQQADSPKRVRDARIHLRNEGILILGHQENHPAIARALGLPIPKKGSWVSARVIPMNPDHPSNSAHAVIGGTSYILAPDEAPPEHGPLSY
ncbi:NaeI family type II restriction endonuclease [Streptomyces lycii]|uniref:Restriction endonuclease n=1 Tax=Streptomyces lycii TaxID=2654337 RepID=A0ABQ7FBM1_9ACTN|nr:NaeI family type II restriction endonuclease [Streptomyces lycii]KAF4405858.1 restriction endonuclease [Streptomyces lycii]